VASGLNMSGKDQVFAEPYSKIKSFAFDEKVVAVFPDMIKRSVPGYDTILKGTAMLAMKYVQPNTHVYDLGTSLGAVSLTVDQALGDQGLTIHAIDTSEPMINGLKKTLSTQTIHNTIKARLEDVDAVEIEGASLVVSNFTLQFMPSEGRQANCQKIYDGLIPGGVFVLSEKLRSSQTMIDFYHGYKKINGYSDMEIAQKRQALEDALRPDSLDAWLDRLHAVGFSQIEVWFKAFNFVSMVAIK